MNSDEKFHPLNKLHEKRLNGFILHLGEIKQLRLSGWRGFKLHLRNPQNILSINPVIKGIYSSGGKNEVKPWMDLEYWEEVDFVKKSRSTIKLTLGSSRLDLKLFNYLGKLIPPGGHFMVSYEGEQKIHSDTIKFLSLGIPPAMTPLGYLLFRAGFQYIKDWYLAEGGHEGPRKLWGEKAPDKAWTQDFYRRTAQQISQFLKKTLSPAHKELEEQIRTRAQKILEIINKN